MISKFVQIAQATVKNLKNKYQDNFHAPGKTNQSMAQTSEEDEE